MPTVSYNSYTLPLVMDKFSHVEDFRTCRVACEFLITADSAANLVIACAAAETALSEINKNLTVSHGSGAEYSYSHSGNTGFLARPHIDKIPNELATECSRAYRFSCEIQLPMTQYGGRRSGSFVVSYAPTRQRTVTFSVEYTATGAGSSETTYGSGAKSWATSVLGDLGGVWELVSERLNEEQENKILTGTLVYKEILFAQSASGTNHSSIVDCDATYSVEFAQQVGGNQSCQYTASPRAIVTISYSAKISRDAVAAATSIDAVWYSTVRPYLINQAYAVLGLGNYSQAGTGYVILRDNKSITPYGYGLVGSLSFLANSSSAILDFSERISIRENTGINDVPIWDGRPNTYSSWGIGQRVVCNRAITVGQMDFEPDTPTPFGDGYNFGYEGTWHLRDRSSSIERLRMGAGSGGNFPGTGVLERSYWTKTWNEMYILIAPGEFE